MIFALTSLPYDYDAFEPYLDKETMEIHHTKHHQTYINNTNDALKDLPDLVDLPVEDIIRNLDIIPLHKRVALRNNAGGHANHKMFWAGLKKGTILQGNLKSAIERDFGSIDFFKKSFENIALTRFGSGWAWVIKKDGKLSINSTANQDSPLMGENFSGISGFPIICLDVWEHAYYLKYKNYRLDYIRSFWNIINWDEAEVRFNSI